MAKIESNSVQQLNLDPPDPGGVYFPEAKSSAFIPEGQYDLINFPFPTARRPRATVREAVAHEVVFRCLALKALAIQDVFPAIQERGADGWQALDNHPALISLRDPNPQQTFADLIAALVIDEDVWGRWYVEKVRSRLGGIVGLRPLDVRAVREIGRNGHVYAFDPFGFDWQIPYLEVVAYEVIEEARPRRIKREDVIAVRLFDIRSPLAGISPVYAALDTVGLSDSLTRYAESYLKGGGPPGVIKVKRQLSPEQADAISERFYERYKLGGRKEGRPAVFDLDGDYQQIGGHLDELAGDTLRQHEQASICGALGVPGQLVQAFYAIRWGNQRAGQESALRQFWDLTLSPTLARYRQLFDKYFLPEFEGRDLSGIRVRTFWDLSNVRALQEDLSQTVTRARENFKARLISRNEARSILGLRPVEGGDEIEGGFPDPPRSDPDNAESRQEEEEHPGRTDDETREDDEKRAKARCQTKARDPKKFEAEIAASVRSAQDSGAATLRAVLKVTRDEILRDGLRQARTVEDANAIRLEVSGNRKADIIRALEIAYASGRATVAVQFDEEKALGSTEYRAAFSQWRNRSLLATGMALTNAVGARIVSNLARFLLRGRDLSSAITATESLLRDESLSYLDEIAQGAAFQAVAEGRAAEGDAQAREGDRWVYSALLDANTCKVCQKADLTEATDRRQLPPVPHPDCEGRWRCRCMHVLVRDE